MFSLSSSKAKPHFSFSHFYHLTNLCHRCILINLMLCTKSNTFSLLSAVFLCSCIETLTRLQAELNVFVLLWVFVWSSFVCGVFLCVFFLIIICFGFLFVGDFCLVGFF